MSRKTSNTESGGVSWGTLVAFRSGDRTGKGSGCSTRLGRVGTGWDERLSGGKRVAEALRIGTHSTKDSAPA